MTAALIIIYVIIYIMFWIGVSILLTYLDSVKWDYKLDGDTAFYIVLGLIWPLTLIALFFRYVIAIPFIKFEQFLVFLSDKFDEIKEEKRKRGE